MNESSLRQRGGISASVVTIVGLSLFSIAFAGLAIWAFVNYTDQKNNVDAKISKAVATAQKEQGDELEAKFLEREKEPNRSFTGPSDFGSVGFKFPKTWSIYIDEDGTTKDSYTAYLNPGTVPSVQDKAARYALRVEISSERYEDIIKDYEGDVEDGKLKTSVTKIGEQTGTRLDGNFTKDIRGSAVIYKIRDKTLTIRTDADTFKPDFENIIKTINFIQ